MRSFIASAVLALAALPSVLAAPASPIQPPFKLTGCTVTAKPKLPDGATIAVNSALKTHFVGLGVGTQNYTCSAAGTYASAGAVAKLYDVSCLVNLQSFFNLTNTAKGLNFDRTAISSDIAEKLGTKLSSLPKNPFLLGDHYFVTNAAGAIAPKFDFTVSQKKSTFVIAKKDGGIPSPVAGHIDWLQLSKVDSNPANGNMGTQIFRVDTRNGVAPTSCTPATATSPAQTTQIPYTAMYWVMD